MRQRWRRLAALIAVAAGLAACSNRGDLVTDNCAHPIAAVYTEQCNPYLSRSARD